jgi:GAF domain-containing protein
MFGTSLDLAEVTRLVLEAAVPGFASGAGVFVLEQLLRSDEPAVPQAGDRIVARRLGTRFADAGSHASQAAFPPGEVIVFPAGSAFARCVQGRCSVFFRRPDGQTLERTRPGGQEILSRYTSYLAVPMTARGAVVGFLALARGPGTPAFCDTDATTRCSAACSRASRRSRPGWRSPGVACPSPGTSSAATGTTSSPCPAKGQGSSLATSWGTVPKPQP